nr:hypothetical protein [Armatimonas sp.]
MNQLELFSKYCNDLANKTHRCVLSEGLPNIKTFEKLTGILEKDFDCEIVRTYGSYKTILITKNFEHGTNIPDISLGECIFFFNQLKNSIQDHLIKTSSSDLINIIINSKQFPKNKNIAIHSLSQKNQEIIMNLCIQNITNEIHDSSRRILIQLNELKDMTFANNRVLTVKYKSRTGVTQKNFRDYFHFNPTKNYSNDINSMTNLNTLHDFTFNTKFKTDDSLAEKNLMLFGKNFSNDDSIASSITILYNFKKQIDKDKILIAPKKISPSKNLEVLANNIIQSLPGSLERATLNIEKRLKIKKELKEIKNLKNTESYSAHKISDILTNASNKREYLLKPEFRFNECRSNFLTISEIYLKSNIKNNEQVKFENLPYMLRSSLISNICGSAISDLKILDDGLPFYISNFNELYIEIKTGSNAFHNAPATTRAIYINKKMDDGKFPHSIGFMAN